MRQICMSGSMSGVWKRSHGRTSEAPPDERGGNSYARPTATAPHSDSTIIDPRCPTNRMAVVGPRPGANEPKLHATEHDRARAVCFDDLTSRHQYPVRLVDPERHDRVGLLLIAETLVGVGGVEGLGCRIEAKKARGLGVGRGPAHRGQGPVAGVDGETPDAVVATVRSIDHAAGGRGGDLGAVIVAGVARRGRRHDLDWLEGPAAAPPACGGGCWRRMYR